eukprot:763908-Hanusia_phi.AAC.8
MEQLLHVLLRLQILKFVLQISTSASLPEAGVEEEEEEEEGVRAVRARRNLNLPQHVSILALEMSNVPAGSDHKRAQHILEFDVLLASPA